MSNQNDFIQKIAPYVQKLAPKYGIEVCSPIIAQACLESAFGTSTKAQRHNYFGLKYRPNRVTCNNGTFVDGSAEQNSDGSYYNITDQWYSFDNMEKGVEGYLQFINIPNYSNLKGVTDPHKYLELIRADGYATSLAYVDNVYKVITTYGLTKYDTVVIDPDKNKVKEESINIVKNTGFQGCNVSTRSVQPQYIVVHYVGSQSTARNNVTYFNGDNHGASADFFVDENEICEYNPNPRKYYSWHCGDTYYGGSGGSHYKICTNGNSLGIETCCYQDYAGWHFRPKTVENLIKLTRYLMKEYNIPIQNVIRHWDISGKECPRIPGWIPVISPYNENEWNKFKSSLVGNSDVVVINPTENNSAESSSSIPSPSNNIVDSYPILQQGSTGTYVTKLQQFLNKLGADLVEDGDFGPITKQAVIEFQKKYSLEVDGIVGNQTWTKLYELTKSKYPKTMTVKKSPGYIRNGYSRDYTIIYTLGKGDKVTALKKVTNTNGQVWYKVNYQGRTGFIVGNNLK